MLKRIIYILMLLPLCSIAQNKFYGTVLSETSRKGIDGATIQVKGSRLTVMSNKDGGFVIEATLPAVFIISHTGFVTQEVPAGVSPMTILLKEKTVTLKEITVSNGYQEISKESTTGSYDKIDNRTFNRSVSTDVLSKLEGITSGLFFSKVSGKNQLFIRGISTLTAGTDPLIVVDNFAYDGDINNINPNDVESVTVLKDAAAAAIWGAKAGNGVIVITTKKGGYGQKAQLTINSNIGLTQSANLYADKSFLNSSDFIDVERFLFGKGKYDADLNNTSSRPVVSPVVELLAKVRAGQMTQADADAKINAYRLLDLRSDEVKYLYRTAVRQQYQASISGGSASVHYLVSGGYDKNLFNAVGSGNERSTFYSQVTVKPVRKLEIEAGVHYAHTKMDKNNIGSLSPQGGKNVLYPYAQLAAPDGSSLAVDYLYRNGYTDTAGGGQLLDWKYKPLDEQRMKDNTEVLQDLLINIGAKYQLPFGFTAEARGQIEKAQDGQRNYNSPDSYFARNFINRFSQRTGATIKRNVPLGGILDYGKSELDAYELRGQLNYYHKGKNSEVNVLAGSEIRNAYNNGSIDRVYGYDDNTLTTANVDYVTNFTLYGNFGTAAIQSNNSFGDVTDRFVSFFSTGSYVFKKRYTITASARKDASNLFGVNTNDKWKPLWSAGGGWKISDEPFYKITVLPLLRLRVTYGYSGNVQNDLSAVPVIRYFGANSTTNLMFATVSTLPNPDLIWEKTGIFNLGADFETKGQKITGSLEYFNKRSTDLISSTPIDPTSGLTQMQMNTASLSGKGIDVRLNFKIINRVFKWETGLLLSYVTNKVTRYKEPFANKGSYAGFSYNITPIVGYNPYALISYRFAGLDPLTGDPMGYVDGVPSKDYTKLTNVATFDEVAISGTTRPPYYGNMIQTFSWKGISLSFNISGKFGYVFRKVGLNYTSFFNSWMANTDFTKRWQKPGDELVTNVPSMVYPAISNRDNFYVNSTATVLKGDLIRLQDVSMGYEPIIKKQKSLLKDLRLYLYVSNCGLLWKANKEGIDPDYGSGLPPGSSVSFGLKKGF